MPTRSIPVPGRTRFSVDRQNDDIVVDDGVADTLVNCGPGNDTTADRHWSSRPSCSSTAGRSSGRWNRNPEPKLQRPIRRFARHRPADGPKRCPPEPVIYKCGGIKATIVASTTAETISSTDKRDVIVARASKDKINPKKGNDLVCGVTGGHGQWQWRQRPDPRPGGADTLKAGDSGTTNCSAVPGRQALRSRPRGHPQGAKDRTASRAERTPTRSTRKVTARTSSTATRAGQTQRWRRRKDFCDGGSNKDRRGKPRLRKKKRPPPDGVRSIH